MLLYNSCLCHCGNPITLTPILNQIVRIVFFTVYIYQRNIHIKIQLPIRKKRMLKKMDGFRLGSVICS